jgi:hypothetical protein
VGRDAPGLIARWIRSSLQRDGQRHLGLPFSHRLDPPDSSEVESAFTITQVLITILRNESAVTRRQSPARLEELGGYLASSPPGSVTGRDIQRRAGFTGTA